MKIQKVVLAVLVCFTLLIALTNTGLALWGSSELETEKVSATFAREAARGGYQIVTSGELKGWIDEKKDMMIVDTMPFEASFKKNHIPGAVNFELPVPEMTSMDDAMKASFEKLLGMNKERTLVFYCGFTKCTRSHNGAMWAKKLGYKNVFRQPGGIKAWVEANYPVEKAK